jgi:hypothetical protein
MTKLLDEALEAVRRLPSRDQDDIACAILQLTGLAPPVRVVLSPEERDAVARSKAAADRGEFATDEQVRAVWAKHGLLGCVIRFLPSPTLPPFWITLLIAPRRELHASIPEFVLSPIFSCGIRWLAR